MSLSEGEFPPDETAPEIVHWYPTGRRTPVLTANAKAMMLTAVGAAARGALAIGALSIGVLAIGRLAVGKARVGELRIDRLVVGELAFREDD